LQSVRQVISFRLHALILHLSILADINAIAISAAN